MRTEKTLQGISAFSIRLRVKARSSRLREQSLMAKNYSYISDDDLKSVIRQINEDHPHSGVSMVRGHLRSMGLLVQQHRIRYILRYLDPASSMFRWG